MAHARPNYIYLVRPAVSHFRLLFASSCIIRYFKSYSPTTQQEDMNHHTSSMATERTETTCGPTYSMTRAIGATPRQKGFICQCRCMHAHSQWKLLTTWTDLSNGHVSASVPPQCRHILQSTWCARPMSMQQTGHDMHAGVASLTTFCVAIVHICRFCFI